jgi:hypothetical protein
MGAFINKEYVKAFIETGLVDKPISNTFNQSNGRLGKFEKCRPQKH